MQENNEESNSNLEETRIDESQDDAYDPEEDKRYEALLEVDFATEESEEKREEPTIQDDEALCEIEQTEDLTEEKLKVKESQSDVGFYIPENTRDQKDTVVEASKEDQETLKPEMQSDETFYTPKKQTRSQYEDIPGESKLHKAKRLVEKTRAILEGVDEKRAKSRAGLEHAIIACREANRQMKRGGMEACQSLLGSLSSGQEEEKVDEEALIYHDTSIYGPVKIQEVSSTSLGAIGLSVLAGLATAVGLIYAATEKLGISLNVTQVPTLEITQNLLSAISALVGLKANANIGAGMLMGSVVLIMFVLYTLITHFKGSKNLHIAVQQLVEAELYASEQEQYQRDIEELKRHIQAVTALFVAFEVLFNEQQGKLKRIVYVEGSKAHSSEYHLHSFTEITQTEKLVSMMKDFLSIRMIEENKPSESSMERLEQLCKEKDEIIEKIYR